MSEHGNNGLKILSIPETKRREEASFLSKGRMRERDFGGHGDIRGWRIGINILQSVDFLFQELAVAQGNRNHYCPTAQHRHKIQSYG